MQDFTSRGFGPLALVLMVGACFGLVGMHHALAAPQQPDAATRKGIDEKIAKLGDAIGQLRGKAGGDAKVSNLVDVILADVEIYHQAAMWATRHNEFSQKESVTWTIEALDRGLERAQLLESSKFDWLKPGGKTIVRGYRSLIDGSVQPYAITYPDEFGAEKNRKWRLDIVLHGRDKSLNEVKFLHQLGNKPAPDDTPGIKIDVFGRGNNAFRWAGETDILEALATFENFEDMIGRGKVIDKRRMVVRGFSMGGAGAWHLGLHHPDMWCVVGPGAGFTSTHGYVNKLPAKLGSPQEECLRIYDAVAYAENAMNVPIVAYSGEKDPQLQAAKNIEALLKPTKLPVQFQMLVAPGLEHQFPAAWQKKAEAAYANFVKKGRQEYPKRVRFVTYTLKYPGADWVDILGMQKHYEKAMVDAEKTDDGFNVATANIDLLRLRVPKGDLFDMSLAIDGQKVTARPWAAKDGEFHVYLQKQGNQWQSTLPQRIAVAQARTPRKISALQGPIDDAFSMPFLCVRATGMPWSDRVDDYAAASLKRFQQEWAKYMRGDLHVKNDADVTSDDIADKHLILFGDPGSNSMLAHVLQGLPLQWTKKTLTMSGKKFESATHAPALIYPNPLNPTRYVVVNSGHTFHAEDFEGSNALLYPRLGDYAVLRLAAKGPALEVERIEQNGLFDEFWKWQPAK